MFVQCFSAFVVNTFCWHSFLVNLSIDGQINIWEREIEHELTFNLFWHSAMLYHFHLSCISGWNFMLAAILRSSFTYIMLCVVIVVLRRRRRFNFSYLTRYCGMCLTLLDTQIRCTTQIEKARTHRTPYTVHPMQAYKQKLNWTKLEGIIREFVSRLLLLLLLFCTEIKCCRSIVHLMSLLIVILVEVTILFILSISRHILLQIYVNLNCFVFSVNTKLFRTWWLSCW